MKQGTTNLIELAYTKTGRTVLRINRHLWKLIRKAKEDQADETHVILDFDPNAFGEITDDISLHTWGVDRDCRCGLPENPLQNRQK